MRSIPIRSGTSPDAIPCAIFPTISVCGMYVSLILQSGFLAFQAATSMSTMSLLPPDRSHMESSPLVAHEVEGPAGAAAAGAAAAGADPVGADPDGGDSVFFPHAAIAAAATRTDTDQLSWNLMPCSSTSFGTSGSRNVDDRASDCIVRFACAGEQVGFEIPTDLDQGLLRLGPDPRAHDVFLDVPVGSSGIAVRLPAEQIRDAVDHESSAAQA